MTMDLILWRHAQAEDSAESSGDMRRALTARGREQAQRMAAWLNRQLPEDARVLCSSALRCEQTASALQRPYQLCHELAPAAATPDTLLAAAGWPKNNAPVLLVGHQPVLGLVVAQLTGLHPAACALRKGAVWWLRTRECNGPMQTAIVSVQLPDML
jgi:phosphohistidine phosphatase